MGAKRPKLAKASCDLQVYLCQGLGKGEFAAYARDNNVAKAIMIDGRFIDANRDEKFDKDIFLKRLEKVLPSRSSEGVVMLDWEGEAFKIVNTAPVNSPKFLKAEKRLLKVLRVAKECRPNAKFGFYAIPGRKYWKRSAEWKADYQNFTKIAEASDILFPSLYVIYPESATSIKQEKAYVVDNVTRALRLGKETNKEVFPVIWHRYIPGNKQAGLKLVPWDQMDRHVKAILTTEYRGKKVGSLVWWGADRFYFKSKNKNMMREASKEETFDEYFSKYFYSYLYKINELIVEACNSKMFRGR